MAEVEELELVMQIQINWCKNRAGKIWMTLGG